MRGPNLPLMMPQGMTAPHRACATTQFATHARRGYFAAEHTKEGTHER